MSVAEALTKSRTWALLAGVAFALAALLWFTKGFGSSDDGVAVALRLNQNGAWVESAPFRPTVTGRYRVSFRVARRFPLEEMECLADAHGPGDDETVHVRRFDCPPGREPGRLQWALASGGTPVRIAENFGAHAGEYSHDFVGRSVGMVTLDRRRTYLLRARLEGASPSMAEVDPTFKIVFGELEELIISAFLYSIGALVAAIIGLGFAIQATRVRRRGYRAARS